jgi:hypothetical protein
MRLQIAVLAGAGRWAQECACRRMLCVPRRGSNSLPAVRPLRAPGRIWQERGSFARGRVRPDRFHPAFRHAAARLDEQSRHPVVIAGHRLGKKRDRSYDITVNWQYSYNVSLQIERGGCGHRLASPPPPNGLRRRPPAPLPQEPTLPLRVRSFQETGSGHPVAGSRRTSLRRCLKLRIQLWREPREQPDGQPTFRRLLVRKR